MTNIDELVEHFNRLDESQQERLLSFARILAKTPQISGEPGSSIIQATGYFDPESLDEIAAAIEEGCERIDWSGWE